jgi:hydroxymethylpyrimidine pyrophosphatase-like HAD family hydrolase
MGTTCSAGVLNLLHYGHNKNEAKALAASEKTSKFQGRESTALLITEDFNKSVLANIKLLAADLDKTLYPNGMGNSITPPSTEAKEHFARNIRCFMEFMGKGRLAIPVTGNSPVLAQQKFDRSGIIYKVAENPGVFCNGSLVLGVAGALEYSAPVNDTLMRGIESWLSTSNGYHEFEGRKYPFAVNCMTKESVLHLPPGIPNAETKRIADGWASMQLMRGEIAAPGSFDWKNDPAYQVNLLLKSKSDFLNEFPEFEEDFAEAVGKIQKSLLEELQTVVGNLSDGGYQGKHVIAPWLETNIVQQGVNKGQSLNRFIHTQSVMDAIGKVDVGTQVMVAGDAANDLPMFLEWGQVNEYNGKRLSKTEKPAVRMIMPDSEDEKLQMESNVKNKVYEVMEAILEHLTNDSEKKPVKDLEPTPVQKATLVEEARNLLGQFDNTGKGKVTPLKHMFSS